MFNKVFGMKSAKRGSVDPEDVLYYMQRIDQVNKDKEARLKYLWKKARSVAKADIFVRMAQSTAQENMDNEQIGETGLQQYRLPTLNQATNIECPITMDSSFFIFWETINFVIVYHAYYLQT